MNDDAVENAKVKAEDLPLDGTHFNIALPAALPRRQCCFSREVVVLGVICSSHNQLPSTIARCATNSMQRSTQ